MKNLGNNYSDDDIKRLIESAINGLIEIFTIDHDSNYYKLSRMQLQKILTNFPKEVDICFSQPQQNCMGSFIFITPASLYCEETVANKLLNKNPTLNQEEIFNSFSTSGEPYLDKNHPNHASELDLAIQAWMELFADPEKSPDSIEDKLGKIMKNKGIKATYGGVQERIAKVITPNKQKVKRGSKLTLTIPENRNKLTT